MQTNNPTAEFGVFGGAVVNLSIRSGTNQFSGSLFEYYRDDSLNARNFFAATKAPFNSHQFGGTFGGPMLRNKAFFFGDYQRLRQDQGRTVIATVPTADMRRGDLTALGTPIFDPLSGQAFAGSIIPGNRINPITRQVADIWPLPNRSGLVDNYIENNVVEQEQDAFDIRSDVNLGRWGSVFGRYSRADRDFVEPPTANIFMAGGNRSESGNYNFVLGHTVTLSSSRLNEFRVGINKYDLAQFGSDFGIPKNNELGIPNGNIEGQPYTFGIADFNVAGYLRTASPGFTNSVRIGRTVQLSDNLTWVVDKHSMKFGGDVRFIQSTLTNPQTQPRGLFTFDRNYTSNLGAANTGQPWASFLLGFAQPRAARLCRHLSRGPDQLRRVLHAGRFPRHAQPDAQPRLRWDLLDDAGREEQPANQLQPAGRVDPRGLRRGSRAADHELLRRLGTASRRCVLARCRSHGHSRRVWHQLLPRQLRSQRRDARTQPSVVPADRPADAEPVHAVPQRQRRVAGIHVGAAHADDRSAARVRGVLLPGRRQAEHGAHVQRQAFSASSPGRPCSTCSYVGTRGKNIFVSRNINVPLPGPGNLDQRRPYLSLAPEHPRHQSAFGRCGILVRLASGESRQALFPGLARAARLYLLEDGGHRVHPASRD